MTKQEIREFIKNEVCPLLEEVWEKHYPDQKCQDWRFHTSSLANIIRTCYYIVENDEE